MNTTRQPLNPFRYGKPVPPERFIGREDIQRTIFGRLNNGESTAIVGEPHIGKSSFLRYIRDEQSRTSWLGDQASQFAFVDIDCHLLPSSFQPSDFWEEVVGRIEESFADEALRRPVEAVRRTTFDSFALKRLFEALGRNHKRAVVMVDEFDVLLHHENFNTAEFFGALRSLAIQTDGLALLTASRMMVGEMNRRSQEINPLGSPFFNNLIEVRLLPLRPAEVERLIDQTLQGTGVTFTAEDRAYILRSSGRHPFLVQLAAAAMFESSAQAVDATARYIQAGRTIQGWAAVHFEDVWQRLNPKLKQDALILASAEFPQVAEPPATSIALSDDDHEMRWLAEGDLIEKTTEQRCAAWRGERWRICAGSFTHWLIESGRWMELPTDSDIPPRDSTERDEQVSFLREKITTTRRRSHVLELQHSQQGSTTDPSIITEIEDLQRAIADDERELRRLGGRV
jgi:hypothetical protein